MIIQSYVLNILKNGKSKESEKYLEILKKYF